MNQFYHISEVKFHHSSRTTTYILLPDVFFFLILFYLFIFFWHQHLNIGDISLKIITWLQTETVDPLIINILKDPLPKQILPEWSHVFWLWYFTKYMCQHYCNGAWLLVIIKAYMSYTSSCRATLDFWS